MLLSMGLPMPTVADPLSPVDVTLEVPSPARLPDNESVTSVLHGTVQTNYPGIQISIFFSAFCKGLDGLVSPTSMTIRGRDRETFNIIVFISAND